MNARTTTRTANEAKYNKIISICYNNLRLIPEAAFGMRNVVRMEILNSWISLLRFHLNVRDFKILIFTCNLQCYSQSHWPHSCQPFHDFAWYYSTIPSFHPLSCEWGWWLEQSLRSFQLPAECWTVTL